MARYGKKLLQKLTFQYCDRMGSSKGMREYIDQLLPAFSQSHPDVAIATVLKRNRFPYVKAEYAPVPSDAIRLEKQLWRERLAQQQETHGKAAAAAQEALHLNSNVIGVKHLAPEDIKEVVWWLSQSQGRRKTKRIPSKHVVSKQPSIQGAWAANTFSAQQPVRVDKLV